MLGHSPTGIRKYAPVWIRTLACATVFACALLASAEEAIFLPSEAGAIERATANELQRLWYAATGDVLPIRDASDISDGSTGWLLGIPQHLPDDVGQWPFGHSVPLYDGYVVARAQRYPDVWVVSAERPEGVSNGVFGALESLGFRFGLGTEHAPSTISLNALARFEGSHSPTFAVRGLIPRFGQIVGASAWNWSEYRAYIDDVRRMGLNAVSFYCTDFDPYAAYEFEGALVGGERAPNTAQFLIDGAPVATRDYLAQSGALFTRDHYGAAASFIADRKISIRASQDVLARAIRYAKSRGLFVGIGFEAFGDPTQEETLEHLAARIQFLLRRYPEFDSLWIWEPRTENVYPALTPKQRSIWDSFDARWSDAFTNVARPERRAEAVRMGLFAHYARQLVRSARPDITVIAAGWRGTGPGFDEFYPGLDRVLPSDMVIAGMDDGEFTAGVASEVGSMRDMRMRIPVLTLERESGLLAPQPVLNRLASALDDAEPQGMLAIFGAHWRTRHASESVAYFARRAWRDTYSADDFINDRARTRFPGVPESQIVPILETLQALDFGWTGAGLVPSQLRLTWQPGIEAKRNKLLQLGYDIRVLFDSAEDGPTRAALRSLADSIDAVLKIDAATADLAELSIAQDPAMRRDAWLSDSGVSDSAKALAGQVLHKDDLGALALFNIAAWETIHDAWPDEPIAAPSAGFRLLRRQAPSTLHVLDGSVVVLDNDAERMEVRVMARPIGQDQFTEQPLRNAGNQTFAISFPPSLDDSANIEFGVVAQLGARRRLTWPPGFPDQLQSVTRHALPAEAEPASQSISAGAPFQVEARVHPDRYSVELTWQTRRGELYTVVRDGEQLGTVPGGWFEDTRPNANTTATYTVEARRGLTGPSERRDIRVRVPDLPLPEPPVTVRATARANRIVLGWQSDAPQATEYLILKYNDAGEVIEETFIEADYGQYLQMSDHVGSGRAYRYTVAGVAPDGRVGSPSDAVDVMSSREPLRPLLQLSFNDDRYLEGFAELAENALALGGAGWAELPPQPNWNPTHALTLSTWVKLDDSDGMPVLITKGTWLQSGYFLQINQGRVRFSMAGIDTLDAGSLTPGKWYLVTATYGFGQMRIYVDGEQVGRKNVSGRPRSGGDALLVGRYIADEDAYFLRGSMDDIRIYDVPLTADEIRTLYEETFRE